MAWRIEIDDKAKKELAALDKIVAKRITDFLRKRLSELEDPRSIGEALRGSKLGVFWKYRVGDYLIIASIEDQLLTVFVVRVGHRGDVYKKA